MSQTVEGGLGTQNIAFLEDLYEAYVKDPDSVPADFRGYFASLGQPASGTKVGPSFEARSLFNPPSPAVNGGVNGHVNGTVNGATNGATLMARPDVVPLESAPPSSGSGPTMSLAEQSLTNGQLRMAPVGSLRPLSDADSLDIAIRQDRVDQLVRSYRTRGHMIAKIDPLGMPRPATAELEPRHYHLTDADMDRRFSSRTIYGTETLTLREILDRLRNTYCRSIGVEFMHMHEIEPRNWLQERMEGTENRLEISVAEQRRILTLLTDSVILEEFIQRKYLGAKSFSLEGSESLIPLLALTIERAAEHGVDEITLGMAHRGRLNVLANIMGKSPRDIFREFEDLDPQLYRGRGDVKYHMGYSSNYPAAFGRKMHLSLCFNPSHLEFVNPVVAGRVRAKQDRNGDAARSRKLALMIHGDAAMAGEGIVQETFNLSQLRAYNVGGSMHVVVNNQIGFTTPPWESRSSPYATDIAKMLQIPIFHVNGEDPEAVAQVVRLAMDFRVTFKRDVVIDMYGYRRHGHNEGDEPSYTQPIMYRAIANKPSIRSAYLDYSSKTPLPPSDAAGAPISVEEADVLAARKRHELESELEVASRWEAPPRPSTFAGAWERLAGGAEKSAPLVSTAVSREAIDLVGAALTRVPAGFHLHPKLKKLIVEARASMAAGEKPCDWGMGEALAFGTLLAQGVRVRLSGQDSRRGTFSHRHSTFFDTENEAEYVPLQHIREKQGVFEPLDSPLSEAGVLGFEYGYSLDMPEALTLWEAQFGDFVNGAQVIIDQFLASSEAKWHRVSGLVMLLPHGMEGQGPEHSNARLDRFLNMSVHDNWQVCNLTTPAQFFHALRRQVLRPYRKPLIVMSPKSLLRHPLATSPLADFTNGEFQYVIPDTTIKELKTVRRVLLCTGKVYYDLVAARDERKAHDVAIIRIEQLFPLHKDELLKCLTGIAGGTPVVWVQEEPKNMGAWPYMNREMPGLLKGSFPWSVVSRPLSSSPATGSATRHKREQARLMDEAFATDTGKDTN